MYTNKVQISKDYFNSRTMRNIELMQVESETKFINKMLPYLRACYKASDEGKFMIKFRAGHSIFHKATPEEFLQYFEEYAGFDVDTETLKGYVIISWLKCQQDAVWLTDVKL